MKLDLKQRCIKSVELGVVCDNIGIPAFKVTFYVKKNIAPTLVLQGSNWTVWYGQAHDFDTSAASFSSKQYVNKRNVYVQLFRNAVLALSLAVCKASASVNKLDLFRHIAKLADNKHSVLPVPAYNFMRAHPHPANKLAMQEYVLLPILAFTFADAQNMNTILFHCLKAVSSSLLFSLTTCTLFNIQK